MRWQIGLLRDCRDPPLYGLPGLDGWDMIGPGSNCATECMAPPREGLRRMKAAVNWGSTREVTIRRGLSAQVEWKCWS